MHHVNKKLSSVTHAVIIDVILFTVIIFFNQNSHKNFVDRKVGAYQFDSLQGEAYRMLALYFTAKQV